MLIVLASACALPASAADEVRIVEADASHIMADSDTLASAEDQVLMKAKRKAVEQSGVYIETLFRDVENSTGDGTSRLQALSVRTIAAAVTETEILEKRHSVEGDRIVLYVKLRAKVHLDWLAETIKRLQADEQLAAHHRQLHREYNQVKAQLDRLRNQLQERGSVRMGSSPGSKDRRLAKQFLQSAIEVQSLPEKIADATRAIEADDTLAEAYIIRGQIYLKVASLASAKKIKGQDVRAFVERAALDFGKALSLNPHGAWGWLGRGDVFTWQSKYSEAAESYERIIRIDPLFDLARQRLITLHTGLAKKLAATGRWGDVAGILEKLLQGEVTQSWIAQQKEAYLLRSQAYYHMGKAEQAVSDATTVLNVDPTNAQAHWLRGTIYRQLKSDSRAREDFERACALGWEDACTVAP